MKHEYFCVSDLVKALKEEAQIQGKTDYGFGPEWFNRAKALENALNMLDGKSLHKKTHLVDNCKLSPK